MERLVMLEGGGTPPVFAYVRETKGLQENGAYQRETKELAAARAKKRQMAREWGVPEWYKRGTPLA